MKRLHPVFALAAGAAALWLCAYALFFIDSREELRLETISGDPAALDGVEISFQIADAWRAQKYTLREGKLTQKNRYLSEDNRWDLTVDRNGFGHWRDDGRYEISFKYYIYCKYLNEQGDGRDYRVIANQNGTHPDDENYDWPKQEWHVGVYEFHEDKYGELRCPPVFLVGDDAEIEMFWAQKEELYCAVRLGETTELRRYSLTGELLETYSFSELPKGFFPPSAMQTRVTERRHNDDGTFTFESDCPPEPDSAQIFAIGDRLYVIGAWHRRESSGIDLYVFEDTEELYHGRIPTELWRDWAQEYNDKAIRVFTEPTIRALF